MLGQYKPCPEMEKEGITDPDSSEGIEFCINKCPYPEGCVMVEREGKALSSIVKATKARVLQRAGFGTKDIAAHMHIGVRQVQRYLDKRSYPDGRLASKM